MWLFGPSITMQARNTRILLSLVTPKPLRGDGRTIKLQQPPLVSFKTTPLRPGKHFWVKFILIEVEISLDKDKDEMVNSESADPKFSIGSNWKNRFYPMNEPEDVLLCEKVREKGWSDEKIAAEIPVKVQIN